jgi:hypothetical protein
MFTIAASKDIHAAVAKSVALLEETVPKFFAKAGCISCHNVFHPADRTRGAF